MKKRYLILCISILVIIAIVIFGLLNNKKLFLKEDIILDNIPVSSDEEIIDMTNETLSDKNNLANVYKFLSYGDITEIDNMFKKMPDESPARMSYNIFSSGSDTIKASVITGLGTRLQSFQNEDLQKLTSETDIDLTLPGKKPCIYYVITNDMDSSFDFIASLFFTFLFIKLVRYANSTQNGKCENDVYFMLLANKLKDSPVSEYNPQWVKNTSNNVQIKEKTIEKPSKKKEKLGWHNF